MRVAIDSVFLKPFLGRNKRTIFLFSLYAAFFAFIIGLGLVWSTIQPMVRDFVVANVAEYKAGPKIPFTEEDMGYQRGFKIDENNLYSWGIESNNVWMSDYIRLIVPYMGYEKVNPTPFYPKAAGMTPYLSYQSFHVAGRMYPSADLISLNERYILDAKWNDQRRALATLVHELVHIQRGAYTAGESAELESATSMATVEVLAAMCNYMDDLACKAFWNDISGLARSSLMVQLSEYGLGNLYNWWANLAWRDASETDAYYKSMRYWQDDMDALMVIRKKYNLVPWNAVVLGVTEGIPLNTQHVVCAVGHFGCKMQGMPYDDTWYLLQGLMWILEK